MASIYYLANNERIPFSQFLKNQKEQRGCSWREMDEICGTKAMYSYVMAQTKGHPNNPPYYKFLRIIQALGYSERDFEINNISK